jgi:sensor histidine kinase YesM
MSILNDKWLRLAGVPVVAVISNLIFYEPENTVHHISWLKAIIVSLVECAMIWEVSRLGIISARKRYPWLHQTKKRITYQVAWFLLTIVVLRVATVFFYDTTLFWGYPMPFRAYWLSVLVAVLFIVPIAAIYEAHYLYRQWWATYYEAEQLKKENLQSQLDSLKAQINPHFLFNSLSTLSSLVSEDPKRAEWFIEELASVYRYLLQTNEQPLTSLENEVQFIRAYFHLLQTRFGAGITLDLDVPERYNAFLLPPLTLQLLVENAAKHNVISPDKPLIIKIFMEEPHSLVVQNTLKKKQNIVPSDGMGLKNIAQKFRLLKQSKIVIRQTDEYFQVTIPLIKTPTYESFAH